MKRELLKDERNNKMYHKVNKNVFTAVDLRHKHHLRRCSVETLTRLAHSWTYITHIYTIGYSHILSKDTYSTGAADEWVFAGRQCESTQLLFFMAVSAKHYVHTQTHTHSYFSGLYVYLCPE